MKRVILSLLIGISVITPPLVAMYTLGHVGVAVVLLIYVFAILYGDTVWRSFRNDG